MKKVYFVILLICLLSVISCSKKENYTIEIKNGVEIVSNNNIGSSPKLQLNLKLLTDINLDEMALPDSIPAIKSFSQTALDDDGNIYISDFRESVVYKVDKNGNYVTNFSRKGQGLGESIVIYDLKVIGDSVFVFGEAGKVSIYTKSGDFVRQSLLIDGKYRKQQIMNDGSRIVSYAHKVSVDWEKKETETESGIFVVSTDSLESYTQILKMNEKKDLTNYEYRMSEETRQCYFGGTYIYLEEMSTINYAIDIYDLNGKKVKTIKKQARKIAWSDEEKEKVSKMNKRNSNIKIVADYMKQILSMYVDKEKNLWIKPAIEGLGIGHNYFDIFNSEGVFMKRIKLSIPDNFVNLVFDKDKLIAIDPDNCKIKVFDYDFN